jgi:serine/threonine-protein kinase RsbW
VVEQSLILLAHYNNLEKIRQFAGQAASASGLKPEEVFSVQLAVDEAFSNIIEHAYGGECDKEIRCICRSTNQDLTFQLRDTGKFFDPTSAPEPDLDANLEERQPGGLGLYFMRRLMDEVQFKYIPASATDEPGNLLIMVKRKEKTS